MTFETTNPFTFEKIKTYQYHSLQQAKTKINKLIENQKKWAEFSLQQRLNFLKKVSENFEMNQKRLATQMSLEMGKPLRQSLLEVAKCAQTLKDIGQVAIPAITSQVLSAHYKNITLLPTAYGVVLSIQPWNFPYWQVVRMSCSAVVSGNVVALKHSDLTAGCAELLEEMFTCDGFSILQNLAMTHEDTEQIIAWPQVQMVTFTGSTKGGAAVASIAGKNLKKSVLELGGSDAYIVLPDADLKLAVSEILKSRMLNTGQSCICAKRVYVHKNLSEKFKELFIAEMSEMQSGDPMANDTQVGPLAHTKFVQQIAAQVEDAKKFGGNFIEVPNLSEKHKGFSKMGLIDFGKNLRAHQEVEVFGPVLNFYSFAELADVVEVLNEGPFALGAGVFTGDMAQAGQLAEKIQVGTFVINDYLKTGLKMPFGGRKKSGYGFELGQKGIEEFISWKVVASSHPL
jgi:succinate-semialdehyde dehydrogenase / glutarate-semialdehyde dehydrogenase